MLALIRKFEGLRLKPYICPAGVDTIGYGSTTYPNGHKVQITDRPVSEAVAEAMMQTDAERFTRAYSGEAGHRFHAKLDTHSRASWTVGA